ncbi:TonB family protein [Hymenobacter persicinus]|uniref:TonB family protein n=1 Tax=Hymenobacter persicinus TaxID=2025506 RepID=UPI0013EA1EC9|nr:TonB family protein [Hymenobacter persicinus]
MPPQLPADPAGHLPLPLLRQYVAGTLPAAEQHRVEAHTLDCPRCADVLDGLAVTDAATTDAALTTLQGRLHQRLAEEAAPQRQAVLWRAMAAVLLLLVLSTAAWFGLRTKKLQSESAEVAAARPAPRAAEPAVAVTPEPTPAPAAAPLPAPEPVAGATRSEAPAASAPIAAARPRPSAAPARRGRARPASAVATTTATPENPAAVVAMVEVPQAAVPVPESLSAAPAPAKGRVAMAAAADMDGSVAAKSMKAKAAPETGAARSANLPPAASVRPQPVGGYRSFQDYLHHNNKFRPEPPAKGLDGTVRVKFTVTAAGQLENFQVVRSLRADYDAAAIRLICEGPAWQPGLASGLRADQVVEMSVSF